MCSDDDRWEARLELGSLGVGCWRIRRRPEAPRPCSCSGLIGDLGRVVNNVPVSTMAPCVLFVDPNSPRQSVQLPRVKTHPFCGIHG